MSRIDLLRRAETRSPAHTAHPRSCALAIPTIHRPGQTPGSSPGSAPHGPGPVAAVSHPRRDKRYPPTWRPSPSYSHPARVPGWRRRLGKSRGFPSFRTDRSGLATSPGNPRWPPLEIAPAPRCRPTGRRSAARRWPGGVQPEERDTAPLPSSLLILVIPRFPGH